MELNNTQQNIFITLLMKKADLLRPPGDEHPKGLAEEGGEEGIKGRWTFQEGVHLVQQGRVRGQLFINLWIHHDISIFL